MRKDVDDWWEYACGFHAMNNHKSVRSPDLAPRMVLLLFTDLFAPPRVDRELLAPRVMDHPSGLTADRLLEVKPHARSATRMPRRGWNGPGRDRVGFAPTCLAQLAGLLV